MLQLLAPVHVFKKKKETKEGEKDSVEAVSGFMMIVLVKQIRSHWSAGFLTDSQEKGKQNNVPRLLKKKQT